MNKKFKAELIDSNHSLKHIRRETLSDGDKIKIVNLIVSDYDWATYPNEDYYGKSNKVLEEERKNFDESFVLYEWQGDNFYKTESQEDTTESLDRKREKLEGQRRYMQQLLNERTAPQGTKNSARKSIDSIDKELSEIDNKIAELQKKLSKSLN